MPHHQPLLAVGGYFFAEHPDLGFEEARIFWSASADPSVLTVTAHQPIDVSFDISGMPHCVIVDAAGHEHIAISDDDGVLRLDVIGGTTLAGPVGLRLHLDCTRLVALKLLALDHLLRLIGVKISGRRPPPADRRLARLIEGLRVVDALAEGATLSEIAAGIDDARSGSATWPGDGDHVKSRIRRRVALARSLMRAGPEGILNYRI